MRQEGPAPRLAAVRRSSGVAVVVACAVAALAALPRVSAMPQYASMDGFGRSTVSNVYNSLNSWFLPVNAPNYADGIGSMVPGPNARNISNIIFSSPPFRYNAYGVSALTAAWGQFMAHDMIMTGGMEVVNNATADDTFIIAVPRGDTEMDPDSTGTETLEFRRNTWDLTTGVSTTNPRRQVNVQTGWMDASTVYGVDADRSALLRTFYGGMMAADPVNGLPYNRHCLPMASGPNRVCDQRLGGDLRANVAPGIFSLHGLFVLEHNYWAKRLGIDNPTWDDETLFQEARKRVMAEIQAITVNQYLTTLLGEPLPPYRGYSTNVDPRISGAFAVAAYRYGHSGIDSSYWCIKPDGRQCPSGNLLLREAYFDPGYLEWGVTITDILRGMHTQLESAIDTSMVPDVRNKVEGLRKDLAAADIMRGRDFGIPSYTGTRRLLGLSVPMSFTDINPNPTIAEAMSLAYNGNVDAVDLWVGGLAESAASGKFIGPTFKAIIKDQFTRLRDGDWYWYENTENTYTTATGETKRYFSDSEIQEITTTTIGKIVARTTDWTDAPGNLFITNGRYALATLSAAGAVTTSSNAGASSSASSGSSTGSNSVDPSSGSSNAPSGTGTSSSSTTSGTGTSTTTSGTGTGTTTTTSGTGTSTTSTSTDSTTTATATTTIARVTVNSMIALEWTPPAASDTILTFTLYYAGDGWVGMGWGSSGMIGADVWLMRKTGNALGGEVFDTKASGYMLPSSDSSQDVTLVSAVRASGRTAFKLRRAFNTGDANDHTIAAGTIPVVFAWDASSTAFAYHGGNRIQTSLNIFAPPASALVVLTMTANGTTNDTGGGASIDLGDAAELSRQALIQSHGWHGVSMFVVWGLLVPAGSIAVRFLKHKPAHQAFHKWTMLTAATITIPAAGGALAASSQKPVSLTHAQLGMTIAGVLLVQVVFGAMVRSWLTDNKLPPWYWGYVKYAHRIFGWFMLIGGLSNCTLGADMLLKGGRWIVMGYAATLVFCVLVLMGYAEIVGGRRGQPVPRLDGDQSRRMSMSQSKFSLSMTEMRANIRGGSKWVIVQGYIYDIGNFIKHHPGGAFLLDRCIGHDVTQFFFGREAFAVNARPYAHSERAHALLRTLCVAALKADVSSKSWADAPTMDDSECTEQWVVARRTVIDPGSRRPVVKLELHHPAAEAVPALEWQPTSFGRHMIAKATVGTMRAIMEREVGTGRDGDRSPNVVGRIQRLSRRSISVSPVPTGPPAAARTAGTVTGSVPPHVQVAMNSWYARSRRFSDPATGMAAGGTPGGSYGGLSSDPAGSPAGFDTRSRSRNIRSESPTNGRGGRGRMSNGSDADRDRDEEELGPSSRHTVDRPERADRATLDRGAVLDDFKLTNGTHVERPYSIVRGDNKPGLILYIRRYQRAMMSPFMYSLREGDEVTLVGPKGLGLHLDNQQSGVVVGIYQGTCVVAAFDLLQYIVAHAKERRRLADGSVSGAMLSRVKSLSSGQMAAATGSDGTRSKSRPPIHAGAAADYDSGSDGRGRGARGARSPPPPPRGSGASTAGAAMARPGSGVRSGSDGEDDLQRMLFAVPEPVGHTRIPMAAGSRPGSTGVAPGSDPASTAATSADAGAGAHDSDGDYADRTATHAQQRAPIDIPGSMPEEGEEEAFAPGQRWAQKSGPLVASGSTRVKHGAGYGGGGSGSSASPAPTYASRLPPAMRPQALYGAGDAESVDSEMPGKAEARPVSLAGKPHLKLVLLVVSETEEIPELDWMRHVDECYDDFELHLNIKTVRDPRALADFPRLYSGRINAQRLEQLLPPTDLLTVSVCGTPAFQRQISDLYKSMGLPRSLLTVVS